MFVSIIMPVYNAAKTLNRSITSIIQQTDSDWELICVDDGSIDNSYEILLRMAEKDNRIKVYRKQNSGPGLTRNYAIARSTGEFIGFLDSDDRWHKTCISEIKKVVDQDGADIVFLGTRFCSRAKEWDAYKVSDFSKLDKKEIISCMMSGILPWGQEKVIRASIIKENGLVYSEDSVGEEAIFSFEALYKSKRISFIDFPMYYYYVNNYSQHKLGSCDPWNKVVKKMKAHLIENNLFPEYETSLNSLAIRAMIIAVYRNMISYSYTKAKIKVKHIIKDYSLRYDLKKFNTHSLDRSSKYLYKLVQMRLYFVIYLLAKYRFKRGLK